MDKELRRKLQAKKPPQSTTTKVEAVDNTAKEGTKKGETRATFIVNEAVLTDIKAIAYFSDRLIKDIIGEALDDFIKKHHNE